MILTTLDATFLATSNEITLDGLILPNASLRSTKYKKANLSNLIPFSTTCRYYKNSIHGLSLSPKTNNLENIFFCKTYCSRMY